MKKVYLVSYEMNGGEYSGELKVLCEKLEQINAYSFSADGVTIMLDENILEITEAK